MNKPESIWRDHADHPLQSEIFELLCPMLQDILARIFQNLSPFKTSSDILPPSLSNQRSFYQNQSVAFKTISLFMPSDLLDWFRKADISLAISEKGLLRSVESRIFPHVFPLHLNQMSLHSF